MSTVINRRDLDFLLYELLKTDELCQREKYSDHDKETFDAVIDLATQIAEEKFLPIAAKMDANEPEFVDGKVVMPSEVREAHEAYIEAGFMGANASVEDGGMQLPITIAQAARAIFASANVACLGYLGLTNGAANLLNAWGSEELKKKYLPMMRDGTSYGTMCLSEPHAGSNLADIRTKAEPQGDGTYHITGTKMWISGGDHELSQNITHMVLAKIPGGPAGVKGISLFLVTKRKVDDEGNIGGTNGVTLAGLNHKMGYRGTTNTLLNFGENEPCVGYLVGGEHDGLRCMFHMMNEARIGVGMGAVMLGYAGYLNSLAYAKERPQGRLPDNRDPESPQVNIIEHTDVKRMLLKQKAYVEGGLSLALYCGRLLDDERTGEADKKAERALLLDLLTPIVKAWPSDYCLKANELAIQVLGGYGYTRDYPVERLYRDNRLNPIHEGTNGIQGMDLLGRKVPMKDGAGMKLLLAEYSQAIADAKAVPELAEYGEALEKAMNELVATTQNILPVMAQNIRLGTANTTAYLHGFGHIVISWLWLKQALAAHAGLEGAQGDEASFYKGKISACRYFFRYELPQVYTHFALVNSVDDTCLNITADQF